MKYQAHELGRGDRYVMFVEVGADEMHISTWFGYDLERVEVMRLAEARRAWRDYLGRGFLVVRACEVGPLYAGLDRDRIPADLVRQAYQECEKS